MHSICRPRKNTKQKDIYHKISFAVLSCSSGLHSCNNILTLSMLQLVDVSWQQLKKKQCYNKNDKFQNVVDVFLPLEYLCVYFAFFVASCYLNVK